MRVVTSGEMREIDKSAIENYKIPSIVLMENAGARAAEIVARKHDELGWESDILVFAGKGKNGGDALVVARHLLALGKKVRLFILHNVNVYQSESGINLQILLGQKIRPVVLENINPLEEFFASASGPFLTVEGLLGTGFKGPLAGLYADVVDSINANSEYSISLDIPTGVDGTSGNVIGQCIHADKTISFGFAKLGHYISPGALFRGELDIVDISLPFHLKREGNIQAITVENVAPLLKKRDRYGHKNSFGHCLLIGGSIGRLGAISMAARACLRMGTGLVTVCTWDDCLNSLMDRIDDEIMTLPLRIESEGFEQFKSELQNFSSIVIGPGLGVSEKAEMVLRHLIQFYHGQLVIDADGINLISKQELHESLIKRQGATVLTPHIGEMSRMMCADKEDVVKDPCAFVERAVESTNSVVLLKGATTFIGSVDQKLYLNHYPNDGMATAGSGDVLAGMIGGLMGQKIDPLEAARLSVFLHSKSGDFAARLKGHRAMTASDIISQLGQSFIYLKKYREKLQSSVNFDGE